MKPRREPAEPETPPLRLLIVDDSALIRRILRQLFEDGSEIQVVGEAANGLEALQKAADLQPDVITMDVRMPVMDGLETTERLMARNPTPILVLTASLSRDGVDITFQMLEAGALDVMRKPLLIGPDASKRAGNELTRRIKLLSRVKVITHLRGRRHGNEMNHVPATYAPPIKPARSSPLRAARKTAETTLHPFPIVVIGASTGGPGIIQMLLKHFPPALGAAVIVVQHIAHGFSAGMVEWLAHTSKLPITLAREGVALTKNMVFVAPAQYNLLVRPDGCIHLSDQPVLLQCPAIDIMMQAAAEVFGSYTIGVLLTGMGRDGALGMRTIRRFGGHAIAQNESSCAVYGMPRAAIELEAVDEVLPPELMTPAIQRQIARLNRL